MNNLNLRILGGLVFGLPPLAEQKRIVAKVDELLHLLDDLEAKHTTQRETQTRFRSAALDALASAEGPAELGMAWARVSTHFEPLFDCPASVESLRHVVFELAVRGRLLRGRVRNGRSGSDIVAEILRSRDGGSLPSKETQDSAESELGNAPYSLPHGWTWARIGETFEVVGGIQKTPARTPRRNHYPYLRVENVQRGYLNLNRVERFELVAGELERYRLERGDLLVIEGNGSEKEIGRCAMWEGSVADCVHQNHIIRCRPVGAMSGPFTLLFLNSPSGMAEMRRLAVTTSGLYSLSVGKVRSILVPVPNEHERDDILGKVEHLMRLCDDLEAKLQQADETAGKLVEAVVAELVAAST